MQTPFHAYYTAMKLSSLQDEDTLLPVFAEGNIDVYPYQVAAALFAMRNPYQNGVILCDEAGMGKSHEAMLILSQSRYEGKNNILIAVPNPDLLTQWAEMISEKYSIPLIIMHNSQCIIHNENEKSQCIMHDEIENSQCLMHNDFDGIVLTTYDSLVQNIDAAGKINWDIIVFEEANALFSVYQEDCGKQAKVLKEFSKDTFKILLTGTPIEKNIMDLYGLIYFIDEDLLPHPDTYMKRYLRKPENYPELAAKVSKYCFRTLRYQAKQYAKIPERLHITLEYEPSQTEKELYNLLFSYIEKPNKVAFPQMEQYDLALMLLGLLSSSTAAIKASLKNIIKRLDEFEEKQEFENMLKLAESITKDTKAKHLLTALDKLFPYLKKLGANQKALIFTESVETQKYLYDLLKEKYKTLIYNGQSKLKLNKEIFAMNSKILLILKYLWENTDEENTVSIADIIRHLSEHGFSSDRKTVAKYIDTLTDFGIDIVKIRKTQNRYFIGTRHFEAPEVKLLIDAVQSSRFITKQKSKELIKKLSAFVAPNQASVLKRHFYFDSRVKTNNEAIYITSDSIQTAIAEKKKISFQYFDYCIDGKQKLRHHGEKYLVSPFDLIWSNDTYYLVGFHDKKEIVAKFRVDRIKNLIVTGIKTVSKPKDYSVSEFFLQEFSMLHGDKCIVTLLCQNDLINSIIDRFGVDVKTTVVDDTHFTVTVPVNLSNIFYGWVFSSEGKMKILFPNKAIEEFKNIIRTYAI